MSKPQRLPDKPHPDAEWDETLEIWTLPTSCQCCQRCRRYVTGIRAGRCIHGGPYFGYIEVPDG